jgi:hypothetical protein
MQRSETSVTQKTLRLAFGVHHAAKPAPSHVLRQIESDAQALAVMVLAGSHKLAYIAACIGKSRSYVSRMQTGSAPIPERLVGPLCAATGSLLLKQYRDLQRALDGHGEAHRLAELLRAA